MSEQTAPNLSGLIASLDEFFVKKAPFQIPDGGKEFLVQFGPWICLVFLILGLPVLLFALGLGAIVAPFVGLGYATGFGMHAIFGLVQIALQIFALPGLFARKMSGWMLVFYSQLVGVASSIVSGSIIGGLIGLIIGLYILFQIREKYTA